MTANDRLPTDSTVLDFLRATAVSLVIVDHVIEGTRTEPLRWLAQRLGWLGVLMFFVHTSLVLMFSLDRTRAGGSALVKHFYLRRGFRIYPLSMFVVASVMLLGLPVASHAWHVAPATVPVALTNLLLVQDLFYQPVVLGVLWSLPLEVQMYVMLPFVFWLTGRGRRVGATLLLWLGFVGLALVQHHISDRLYVLQFAPCFMGGILAYCLTKQREPVLPFWAWPLVLAAVLGAYLLSASLWTGEEPMALSWVFGLALGLLVPRFRETKVRVIGHGSMLVAKYSYGVYLTHSIALWLVINRLGVSHLAVVVPLMVAVTGVMSWAAYHAIEAPLIGVGARLAARYLQGARAPAPANATASAATT